MKSTNVTLLVNRAFADEIKVRFEIRPYWIRVGPKCNDCIPMRKRKRHTVTHRGHVKMEAGIAVMLTQPKKYQEPAETGKGKKKLFP